MTERPTDSITIGKRHRRELGNLDSLAANIERDGLLHPVVIKPDGQLVAGERRLRACQALGWKEIPVRVLDVQSIVRAEAAENFERQDFTPSEAVAIKRTLEPEMKAEAERRMKTGQPLENFSKGRAADKTSAFTGYSRFTLDKAEAIVAAAEAEPDKYGWLREDMDRTGKVDRAFKQLRIEEARQTNDAHTKQGGKVSYLTALAESGFRAAALLVDPPWPWVTYGEFGKVRSCSENHYRPMSFDDIKQLPVMSLAAPDSTLFLLAPWPWLPQIIEVISAWGFTYKTAGFVWVKQNRNGEGLFTGMGYWTRACSQRPRREDGL